MRYLLPVFILISVTLIFSPGCGSKRSQVKPGDTTFVDLPDYTITNLYDAIGNPNPNLIKDYGFSAIVRYNGKTILIDGGSHADILKNNAAGLSVDLRKVDAIVVSHTHFDHINGVDLVLSLNPKVKIYMPADFYWGAPVGMDLSGTDPSARDSIPVNLRYFEGTTNIAKVTQSGRFWKANVEYINADREIFPGVKLIATSSANTGYFNKYPYLTDKDKPIRPRGLKPEDEKERLFLLPELSVSFSTANGQLLIVGCSHSTLPAIVEEANRFTGDTVRVVYGGLHLNSYSGFEIGWMADRIRALGVQKIAPNHCTGHLGIKIMMEKFGEDFIFAGLGQQLGFGQQ